MKFNTNQKYTRWSIRRLSVGVASVVVASGFFLLVGQPNTVHADDLTSTPTKVLQEDSSLLEKNKLPETALKEEMDSALSANQSAPKEEVDETISLDKSSLAPKEEVVKPKEEQTMAEVSNQKEEAKPEATLVDVSNRDREANTSQSVTTPDEVRKGVEANTKDSVDVPASYLEKANVPGPFLAGVNQVIPYEAFGGDGMLTRLLLKASDKAPWSENGTAKNPALLPLEGLAKGQYFYEVDLNGNTVGKDGQALLEQLRANGTHTYSATIKVYGSKDGKPDLTNLVATRQVTIRLHGLEMMSRTPQGDQMAMPSSTSDSMNKMKDMMKEAQASEMRMGDSMAETRKNDGQPMLPNTGEAQTNTAGLGALGLVLAGLVGFLGWKTKRED